jgi:hypothetical protein
VEELFIPPLMVRGGWGSYFSSSICSASLSMSFCLLKHFMVPEP